MYVMAAMIVGSHGQVRTDEYHSAETNPHCLDQPRLCEQYA